MADEIVEEPHGGAHSDPKAMAATLKEALLRNLRELEQIDTATLLDARYNKFRVMGQFGSDTDKPFTPSPPETDPAELPAEIEEPVDEVVEDEEDTEQIDS